MQNGIDESNGSNKSNGINGNNGISELINGYKQFYQAYFEKDNQLYEKLVKTGQQPKYLVIACSDSRVDPAIIMNCEPGDLFVIRNVANLVPPCEHDTHYHGTSAALEFGICNLGIKHILIMGHSQCGGITALLENQNQNQNQKQEHERSQKYELNQKLENSQKHENSQKLEQNFINRWIELAKPACLETINQHPELSTAEQVSLCARKSLLLSIDNLKTFPWVRDRVQKGTLHLHAWYFDINTGKIELYNPKHQQFEES